MAARQIKIRPLFDRRNKKRESSSADKTEEAVLVDNREQWNTESLKHVTELKDADLIYVSFQSEVKFLFMHLNLFCMLLNSQRFSAPPFM